VYSLSASVSDEQKRFVVHDPAQGAQIFDLNTLESIPGATIPYSGPRISVPILYGECGCLILVGSDGKVKFYNPDGEALGDLGIDCCK
jgi:hypothetical protein